MVYTTIYHIKIVICWMVYDCFTHITPIRAPYFVWEDCGNEGPIIGGPYNFQHFVDSQLE